MRGRVRRGHGLGPRARPRATASSASADIDDRDLARVARARMDDGADLRGRERDRELGLDRDAERHAAVGVEARRNVEGDRRQASGVDHRDQLGRKPGDVAGEARAEERVDHATGAAEGARERLELVGRDGLHLAAGALPGLQLGARRRRGCRSPGRRGSPRRARRFFLSARATTKPSPPLFPFPASTTTPVLPDMREALEQQRGGAGAGALHQGRARVCRSARS